jgi:hypothetical protein
MQLFNQSSGCLLARTVGWLIRQLVTWAVGWLVNLLNNNLPDSLIVSSLKL